MTDAEQLNLIRKCTGVFISAGNALADAGAHPVIITEGALCAVVEMLRASNSAGMAIDWLRNTADHLEARALRDVVMPTIN
jgi:hypothetical protein